MKECNVKIHAFYVRIGNDAAIEPYDRDVILLRHVCKYFCFGQF